jgi:hypothetical protein
MSSAPRRGGTAGLGNPFSRTVSINIFLRIEPCYESGYIMNNRDSVFRGVCRVLIREGSDRIRSGQLRVGCKLEG